MNDVGLPIEAQIAHRGDRGARLATTRGSVALANGPSRPSRWSIDRRDRGLLGRPCPSRGAACPGVRPRRRAFDEATAVAIHGDAHPWNVLESATGGFKLIDPDGCGRARARPCDPTAPLE
jgi:hypothetical protein